MSDPVDSSRGSHRKVQWNCDCGRTTVIAICTVVSGNTSSCRKCNMLTAEHMSTAKFGKLRMKDPADHEVWVSNYGLPDGLSSRKS